MFQYSRQLEKNDFIIHIGNPDTDKLCHSGYNVFSHELVKLLCVLLEIWDK